MQIKLSQFDALASCKLQLPNTQGWSQQIQGSELTIQIVQMTSLWQTLTYDQELTSG